MNKKGFTLIELLAVIAILAIISVIVAPGIFSSYNEATNKFMKTQEREVLDATNVFLEDYCIHPINDTYIQFCNSNRKTIDSKKVYFCFNTVKSKEYIHDIKYKSSTDCRAIITYEYSNGKYTDGVAHLYCGSNKSDLKYKTDGDSSYINYAFASGC